MPKSKKVKSLEDLRLSASQSCGADIFIVLGGGCIRSSKQIWWNAKTKKFEVLNLVDGTEQKLTLKQIMDREYTNIGFAITQGALYYA